MSDAADRIITQAGRDIMSEIQLMEPKECLYIDSTLWAILRRHLMAIEDNVGRFWTHYNGMRIVPEKWALYTDKAKK